MHRWINKEGKLFAPCCFNFPQCLGIQEKVSFSKFEAYSLISSHLAGCGCGWGGGKLEIIIRTKITTIIAYIHKLYS